MAQSPANMETVELNMEVLKQYYKVYDHLKTHMKRAVMQFKLNDTENMLTFLIGFGKNAVLKLKIYNALTSRSEESLDLDYVVRNTSYGNSFMHSREFFGEGVKSVAFSFYNEADSTQKFVKSEIEYDDGLTATQHKSVIYDWSLNIGELQSLYNVHNKILLSNKTVTAVQKWIKNIKGIVKTNEPEKQNILITINKTLSVMVLSIEGRGSMTIDFQSLNGDPADAFLVVEKQVDLGCLSCDSTASVNLESFSTALGSCKIAGMMGVALNVYACQVLEVEAVPVKQHEDKFGALSMFLLDGGEPVCEQTELEKAFQEDAAGFHEGAENSDCVTNDVGEINEEEKEKLLKEATIKTLKPEPKGASKRKQQTPAQKAVKSKKSRTAFNPMI